MKNGALETAAMPANKTAGSHQRAWPVRIILSAKKRNQRVKARQKLSVEPMPDQTTINGCASRKAMLHQAARSPA